MRWTTQAIMTLSRSLRCARLLPGIFLDVCLVGVVWASVALHLGAEREQLLRQAALDDAKLAEVVAQDVSRSLGGMDRLQLLIQRASPIGPARFDLPAWHDRAAALGPGQTRVEILDLRGRLVASSHPTEGGEQITSLRRVPGFPLMVKVGLDPHGVLAPFERDRPQYLAMGAGLSLLVLGIAFLLSRQKRRVQRSRADLSAAVEHIGQGLIMTDRQGRMRVVNSKAIELLGIPHDLLAPRALFAELLRWKDASGISGLAEPEGSSLSVFPVEPGDGSGWQEHIRPNGTILHVRTQHLPDGRAVSTFTDVTERRRAEQRIRHLACHDPLTGLANRLLLHDRLATAVARAEREGGCLAVLSLGLDRFKAVNDSYGHATGDRVLVEIADRLRHMAGLADTVARVGGDEFVFVRGGLGSRDEGMDFAAAMMRNVTEPVQVGLQRVFVGACLGMAIYPTDGLSGELLIKNASTALDQAKSEGRGMFRCFEPEMDQRLGNRRMIERELRAAIDGSQLALHFQPMVSCGSGGVTCMEALLRWTHPLHGPIPPAEFIPIAEESGLIIPLGAWVLEQACTEAASWPVPVRLAVNLSVSQFRGGDLPALVGAVLARTGFEASRLELEVTESLLIEDAELARTSLIALRTMGVHLALDDFGTGYSNLSYLLSFRFEKIKVDRSFVKGLEVDANARAIVQALLAMTGSLGLGSTAEGVETEQQMCFLRAQGCAELQGYLLGRPMPADEVGSYLASRAAAPARSRAVQAGPLPSMEVARSADVIGAGGASVVASLPVAP
jgi:diguanylate cyclase (GGDEF)-like protein